MSNNADGAAAAAPAAVAAAAAEPAAAPADASSARELALTSAPYGAVAWNALVADARRQPADAARASFERAVARFPTAGQFWRLYIETESAAGNMDRVWALFGRCLRQCCSRDLWRMYLQFVKQVRKGEPNFRPVMLQAYKLAADAHGMDIGSLWLWQEYAAFVAQEETSDPWQKGKNVNTVRQLYHRALSTPMMDSESLWRSYETFEQQHNAKTAEAELAAAREVYTKASRCLRTRKSLWDKLTLDALARPPAPDGGGDRAEGNVSAEERSAEERTLSEWRQLVDWERSNPQGLEKLQNLNRVLFAYNQCLVVYHHYAEVWFGSAEACISAGYEEMARQVLKRGVAALPANQLVTFAFADYEELHDEAQTAKDAFENLLLKNSTALVWVQYMRFARRALGVEASRVVFRRARKEAEADAACHQIYAAAASIEVLMNKNTAIAANIFEWGLKKFVGNGEFVASYAQFLATINDEKNLRLLYERALVALTPDEAREIWNRYVGTEYAYTTDLRTTHQVEDRRAESNHMDLSRSRLASLLQRYRFGSLWPCTLNEANSIMGHAILQSEAQAKVAAAKVKVEQAKDTVMKEAETRAKDCARPNVAKMKKFPEKGTLPGTGFQMMSWPPPRPLEVFELPQKLGDFVERIMFEFPSKSFTHKIPMPVDVFLAENIHKMDASMPAALQDAESATKRARLA